jgi:DNA-binding CsgD family transcriptional regulator
MPPISEAQVEGMRVLAPHLRRAVIISGLLENRAQAAASFEAALSGLGSAVLLVDDSLRVIYSNAKAEQMLRNGDPIALRQGRLDVPLQLIDGELEATVAAAVSDGAKLSQAGSGIAARHRDGTPAIVHVLPLQRRTARLPMRAVAAVFLTEPNAPMNLPIEAVKLLYGLRPAEARVFELIVAGLPGRGIAEALGIAPSTVKTHTLRLFDKLGIHSRTEVVKLAREMSHRTR